MRGFRVTCIGAGEPTSEHCHVGIEPAHPHDILLNQIKFGLVIHIIEPDKLSGRDIQPGIACTSEASVRLVDKNDAGVHRSEFPA